MDVEDFKSHLTEDLDLLILCNPNNPTSTCIRSNTMREILDVCKESSIYVMVDETYIEFVDDISACSAVSLAKSYNNIIILRGTSKFFASPGLRLGYAITGNEDLLHQIHKYKNPWMINSLAEVAGKLMFQDDDYIQKTRTLIASERKKLYQMFLDSPKYTPFEPTANFMLIRIDDPNLDSGILFERCIKEKMMIRDCSTFPFLSDRFIRICFMSEEDNARLAKCLLEA